jgi:hypothetical protein
MLCGSWMVILLPTQQVRPKASIAAWPGGGRALVPKEMDTYKPLSWLGSAKVNR